jgi:Regulatory CLIP domain of proteinases
MNLFNYLEVIFVEESLECTTPGPDKKIGQCIPLQECKPLLSYMMTGLTQKVVSFLRESLCGFEGIHPKVRAHFWSKSVQFFKQFWVTQVCCPPEVGLIEPVQSIAGIEEPLKSEEVTPEPIKPEATEPAVPQEATPEPSKPEATEPAVPQEASPEPSNPVATEPAVPQEATPEPSKPEATEPAVPQETSPEPSKSEDIEPAEPDDDTLSCGKRSSGDSWPWLVQLTTLLSLDIATGKHSSRTCVGVLFSDQHIITTAHCTEGIL